MTQSGYIAAALLAGFVFYLAAKGRLPTYANVLWGKADAAPLPTLSQQATSQAAQGTSNALSPSSIGNAIFPGAGGVIGGAISGVAGLFGLKL